MSYGEMVNYKNDHSQTVGILVISEILTCTECNYMLEEKDYVDCGLYNCPHCHKMVDADLEEI